MNLQTSCFNSAVFRSDVKRLWWIPALHTISVFLFCLFPLYSTYHGRIDLTSGISEQYEFSVLFHLSSVPYILLGILTVGLAVLLFSYMNSKSAAAAMHAMPVKRQTLYITHALFGLTALLIPILINGGILVLMRTNPSIAQTVSTSHIGTWILTQVGYAVIGFAFAVFVGMFTGNSVAHLVLTYIFALLPYFAEATVRYVMKSNLYGYTGYADETAAAKFVYFSVERLSHPTSLLIYAAYALVLLFIGCLIYKIRHLENNGEVVAFPKLKPIFIYGVSVCSGMVGYFYLGECMNVNSLFFALPFGFLGVIIANMLIKKSFTLKGALKPALALSLTVSALFCLFYFDITGFEGRIPDFEKIESVSVTNSPEIHRVVSSYNGITLVNEDAYVPNLTNGNDIENVLYFHRYKTVERTSDGENTAVLYLRYNLKNGKTMNRRYIVDFDDDKEYLKPIMETEENLKYRFPILGNIEEHVTELAVCDTRLSGAFNSYFTEKKADVEIIDRLIDALRADLNQVTYEEFIYQTATPTYIKINYKHPMVYEGTDILADEQSFGVSEDTETYCIRRSYTNTIALLTELGFYDALPHGEDYDSIEVWHTQAADDSSKPAEVITDRAQIEEIYSYVTEVQPSLNKNYYEDMISGSVITLKFKSDTVQEFTVVRSKDDVGMPRSLASLFR